MLESGYRISDLNSIPITGDKCNLKNKIALDNTFLFGYAHTVYGTTYNKHNYKIPLDSLREDIKGYIGIESLSPSWSEQVKLWHGSWENKAVHNKSYVWQWRPEHFSHEHYSPEKFADLENSYYIIKDAPFPFETGDLNNRGRGEIAAIVNADGSPASVNMPIAAGDPYPESNKLVTKSYIDERLACKRLVEVTNDFWVRDYDCAYMIRSSELIKLNSETAPKINIHFPVELNKRAAHNKLEFTILLEGTEETDGTWSSSLTKNPEWFIYDYAGEPITTNWLNDSDNSSIDLTQKLLYDNVRYCILRVEVVINDLKPTPVEEIIDGVEIITSWEDSTNLTAFIGCDNFIYRSKGINNVNGFIGSTLNIVSEDNTVFIKTTQDNSTINLNLSTNFIADNGITILKPAGKDSVNDNEENGWKIGIKDDFMVGDKFIDVSYDDTDGTFRVSFDESQLDIKQTHPDDFISGDGFIDVNYDANNDKYSLSLDTSNLNLNKTHTEDFIAGDNYIDVSYDSANDKFNLALDTANLNIPTNKTFISEVPNNGIIDISKLDSSYYLSDPNLNISFDISKIESGQTINTTIYYKAPSTGPISVQDVNWAMREKKDCPNFIANRLYSITFTYFPGIPNIEEAQIIGKINWFRY